MNVAMKWVLWACLSWVGVALASDGGPMNNDDVIRMWRAKMPEQTILMAIESSRPNFNTSSQGLIAMHSAGVPQTIVEAVIAASRGSAAPARSVSGSGSSQTRHNGDFNPEEVVIVGGNGSRVSMRYLVPNMRTAARGLGFGGVATYAVLNGVRANHRITDTQPSFLVLAPENAQPESYATLVHLAVRRNNTREVLIGGGYMSYSTGIHPDRVVQVESSREARQVGVPDGYVLYRLTPTKPLIVGEEYAVVFYNTQFRHIGYFMRTGDSYFDFGVDN